MNTVNQWLNQVCQERRFDCRFQPIIVADHPAKLFGFECLTRVANPQRSGLSVFDLMRLAEDRSLKQELHRAVLDCCLDGLAQVPMATHLFVNICPDLFLANVDAWDELDAKLSKHSIAAERLVFEMVETDRAPDRANLFQFAVQCRFRNIRIAVDDLGSQPNPFAVLNDIQPEFIKLEMELVTGCHEQSYRAKIVKSILNLARELGAISIVEGIETAADWDWICRQRADLAQGYYLGRPHSSPTWHNPIAPQELTPLTF